MPEITEYQVAALERLADRPKCDWPEVALIGDAGKPEVIALAADLRRAGIATQTSFAPVRRQLTRAKAADADYAVFADTLEIRDLCSGSQWRLNAETPVDGVLFAVNCGYLPMRYFYSQVGLAEASDAR